MYDDFDKNLKTEKIVIPFEKADDKFETKYEEDSQTRKELESAFKNMKIKLKFNNVPKVLKDGKISIISKNIVQIYDDKKYNILYEFKFQNEIISHIQLDNGDLIFVSVDKIEKKWSYEYDYAHLIYRLKDNKYCLIQTIKEDMTGYAQQKSFSGCMAYPKKYAVRFIKEISGNRFICFTNYGFKIYSLNDKNEYYLDLLSTHSQGINTMNEINENTFIFCINNHCGASLGGPSHDRLKIEIIKLNKIKNNDLYMNEVQEEMDSYYMEIDNIENIKKVIKTLKLSCSCKEIFKYSTYYGSHDFSDGIFIKDKYFIIMVDSNILIFNVEDGKQLKRYETNISSDYYSHINIKKWNNVGDNQFFIFKNGYIILFELNDDEAENVKLKIKYVLNFPYIKNIERIDNIGENINKFYGIDGENCVCFF